MTYTLVLLRHGESTWNQENLFAGWHDCGLSETGLAEAERAGALLRDAGLRFDVVHTSLLRRAITTTQVALDVMDQHWLPVKRSWRLNERHYGALQGMNKTEIFATWGEAASRRWWRGVEAAPPPLADDDPRHPRFDPLYAAVPAPQLPASESLRDCQRRLLPYWQTVLVPALQAGQRLLVVSHGNTLRALMMHLDALNDAAVETLEIPSGVPCLYEFDSAMRVSGRTWLDR